MKVVFWVLILANLGLLLWATGHYESRDSMPVRRPPIQYEHMALVPGLPEQNPVNPEARVICYELGPFMRSVDVDLAGQRLARMGLVYNREQRHEQVVEGYRVLMGRFATEDQAQLARRGLVKKGFHGHYVIRPGRHFSIALGFFRQLTKAEHFVNELKIKKIDARIKVRTQTKERRDWLQIQIPQKNDQLANNLQGMDWGHAETRLVTRPCG
ncbi:MAG TPA: SPOR domain-containing protein [Acidiferrobacteraceae bacterium]|nr:SPOR domain-containing protein [Acidiferrobacteraceae bacterium]